MGDASEGRCMEYACGFCLNSEFYVEGLTKKCTMVHDSCSKKEIESGDAKHKGEVAKVLKAYRNVIRETEMKALNNEYCLRITSDAYNKIKSLDALRSEVVEEKDLGNMKLLLKVNGACIKEMMKISNSALEYSVCKTCSSILPIQSVCDREEHDKYRRLREVTDRLSTMYRL